MMKSEFTRFTKWALEDVISLAEERGGKPLTRAVAFAWMASEDEPIREHIVETLVSRVFIDDDAIYPCVDLGVWDLLADGTPVIVARIAGYAPLPFRKNWTGRDGPYVRILGQAFIAKVTGAAPMDAKSNRFSLVDMYATEGTE